MCRSHPILPCEPSILPRLRSSDGASSDVTLWLAPACKALFERLPASLDLNAAYLEPHHTPFFLSVRRNTCAARLHSASSFPACIDLRETVK